MSCLIRSSQLCPFLGLDGVYKLLLLAIFCRRFSRDLVSHAFYRGSANSSNCRICCLVGISSFTYIKISLISAINLWSDKSAASFPRNFYLHYKAFLLAAIFNLFLSKVFDFERSEVKFYNLGFKSSIIYGDN